MRPLSLSTNLFLLYLPDLEMTSLMKLPLSRKWKGCRRCNAGGQLFMAFGTAFLEQRLGRYLQLFRGRLAILSQQTETIFSLEWITSVMWLLASNIVIERLCFLIISERTHCIGLSGRQHAVCKHTHRWASIRFVNVNDAVLKGLLTNCSDPPQVIGQRDIHGKQKPDDLKEPSMMQKLQERSPNKLFKRHHGHNEICKTPAFVVWNICWIVFDSLWGSWCLHGQLLWTRPYSFLSASMWIQRRFPVSMRSSSSKHVFVLHQHPHIPNTGWISAQCHLLSLSRRGCIWK